MNRAYGFRPSPGRPQRRGFAAIYVAIILVVLCGFVSLGVDLGRVQLAKSQLQTAADAAARAAAHGLATSAEQAIAEAVAIASANPCDISHAALVPNQDIEFGAWDSATRSFTPAADPSDASAIRITARRIAQRNTAIPLTFARLVGKNTCDIHATAIATVKVNSGAKSGFVGLLAVDMKNNAFFGSYDSSVNTHPSQATASDNCMLGSNGIIVAGNNNAVCGDVNLGPHGILDGNLSVSGSIDHLADPLPIPDMPDWSPGINPGGIPREFIVKKATALPGGTYWFTSLDIRKNLSFAGPATVYVNGHIVCDANLTAAGDIPANLKIYQLGLARLFGDDKANHVQITAEVHAPESVFTMKNKLTFRGSATFGEIHVRNSADFFYDEASGADGGSGGIVISLVQ